MKHIKHFFLPVLLVILIAALLPLPLHLAPLPAHPGAKFQVVKVNTGYWVIDAITRFNTKALSIAFHHPNTGTKKVNAGSQVLGVKFALYNPGAKEIKVRRNDFLVNGATINHFLVKEKQTQGLVVKVPAGKAIGITNYYIIDNKVGGLKDLKVVYSSVNKSYKKVQILIPLFQKKQKR
jgi:hypothetical protein